MKTNFIKPVFFAAFFTAVFSGCVQDDEFATPSLDCVDTSLTKTKEVSAIAATAVVTQYTDDDVIEAYVTSSDEGGNFFKSISFQTLDGSRGFSVPVDVTSTFVNFAPGRKVFIKLKDLYVDSPTNGAIGVRIGDIYVDPSFGDASVGRLSEPKYRSVLNRSCTVVSEDSLVKKVTIQQAKNDNILNILIEIDDIQFADGDVSETYYDEFSGQTIGGATNRLITDIDGNSVIFRTSSFSTYGGNVVPGERGKIRGIMTKYNGDYQFVVRTQADIQLTEPRRSPIFTEGFEANFPDWIKYNVTGAQVWTLDTTFGHPGACAKMSGFSGSAQANEDWLISPAIDLTQFTTGATLTFETATKFAGNALVPYFSTNYDGVSDPSTATWTQLTATLSPSSGSYIWTASGGIDISPAAGSNNVRIAFKYTSTTDAAATWEVDNVTIIAF